MFVKGTQMGSPRKLHRDGSVSVSASSVSRENGAGLTKATSLIDAPDCSAISGYRRAAVDVAHPEVTTIAASPSHFGPSQHPTGTASRCVLFHWTSGAPVHASAR